MKAALLNFSAIRVTAGSNGNRWYIKDRADPNNFAVCVRTHRVLKIVRALNQEEARIVFALCRPNEVKMYGTRHK